MYIIERFNPCKGFYNLRVFNNLDVLDILIRLSQTELLLKLLPKAPVEWISQSIFQSSDRSRLSCLFTVLYQKVRYRDHRSGILEFVKKAISSGIDPNLELSNPIYPDSVEYHYVDDPVYQAMKENVSIDKFDFFVRYVGVRDLGRDFRFRTTSLAKDIPIESFTGETLFSVYYEYCRDRYHKRFRSFLVQRGLIDPKTILYSVTHERPMSYLTMIFENSTRDIIVDGTPMFRNTPKYMLYVPSAGAPLNTFLRRIETTWDVFMFNTSNCYPYLKEIFQLCLARPREEIFNKLRMNTQCFEDAISCIKTIEENQPPYLLLLKSDQPSRNGLAKLLITDFCLEKICTELNAGNYHSWEVGFTPEVFQVACERQFETIRYETVLPPNTPVNNEWYISDGERVDLERYSTTSFITSDSYCFRYQELENLLENKLNPFTRQPFSDEDLENMYQINKLYNEWWILFPDSHKINSIDSAHLNQKQINMFFAKRIDDLIDRCPFFIYGERLTPLLPKFQTVDVVHACYLYLLTNPEELMIELNDGFINNSIGFQYFPVDHSSIEEINIYYSSLFSKSIARIEQRDLELELGYLLTWALNIIESTMVHESVERFHGRLFTVNTLLNRVLKPIG
jgi:hypothetical protein